MIILHFTGIGNISLQNTKCIVTLDEMLGWLVNAFHVMRLFSRTATALIAGHVHSKVYA